MRSRPVAFALPVLALAAAACGGEPAVSGASVAAATPAAAVAPAPAPVVAPVPAEIVTVPAILAPVEGAAKFDAAKATATITVKAVAKGDKKKMRPISFNAECGKLHTGDTKPAEETVVYGEGDTLQNVVVYVSKGAEKWSYDAATAEVLLDQRNCMYIPHVFTVQTNQPIKIISSDTFAHNVHASPNVKENDKVAFNETQMNNTAPPIIGKFPKPEIGLPVKCDIHNWMQSYVSVFPHPFHGVTGKDGTVALPKLPAGEYEVSVWHEGKKIFPAMPAAQKVTVADGEAKTLEFVFEVPAKK
jgi:hypothetical protein